MKKLLLVISTAVLFAFLLDRAECSVFDAGMMTYKVLRVDQNLIRLRFSHSFIQIDSDSCKTDCNESIIGGDILSGDITYNNVTKKFKIDGEVDCANNIKGAPKHIAYGIRETEIVIPYSDEIVSFSYSDCCGIAQNIYTYNKTIILKADFKLVLLEDGGFNQPPNTKNVELYKSFSKSKINEYQLNITDENDHEIKCSWIDESVDRKGFSLDSKCKLTIPTTIPIGTYSIGILARDFDKNDTSFENPFSTVPIFLIIDLVSSTSTDSTIEQCENPKKPVSILNIFNLADYTTTTTTTTTRLTTKAATTTTVSTTASSVQSVQYVTSTIFILSFIYFFILNL